MMRNAMAAEFVTFDMNHGALLLSQFTYRYFCIACHSCA